MNDAPARLGSRRHRNRRHRSEEPSDAQRRVLEAVDALTKSKGHAPAHREIAAHLGIHVNAVSDHLQTLRNKQLVTWEHNKPRTLAITDRGAEALRTIAQAEAPA